MTKTFGKENIIRVSDTLTVLAEESKEAGYYVHPPQTLSKYPIAPPHLGKRIIATIGTERLEGVPAIEVKDELQVIMTAGLNTLIETQLLLKYKRVLTEDEKQIAKEMFWNGFNAPAKGGYSLQDIADAYTHGAMDCREAYEFLEKKNKDGSTDLGNKRVAYIEAIKQPKQITELVLDLYDWSDKPSDIHYTMGESNWGKQYVGKLKETNGVIIPVSIKYN